MKARLLAAAAAVICAGLAHASVRTWRAEQAFERGVAADIARPATDAPGRLEAYLEARDLDPLEPLYAFRAAQVGLARSGGDPAAVERSLAMLREASRGSPLDPRVRIALAQALLATGDTDGALAAADAAATLGPRHPSVLSTACDLYLRIFRRTQDPDVLLRALRHARLAQAVHDDPSPGADIPKTSVAKVVLSRWFRSGGISAQDVLLAATGEGDLLRFAASLLPEDRVEERDEVLRAADAADAARAAAGAPSASPAAPATSGEGAPR